MTYEDLTTEQYSEAYDRASATVDRGSDDFDYEVQLQVKAICCMKGLREDVRSWPVKPSEKQLQALAELRANVALAGDHAALLTGIASKDMSDMSEKERAEIKEAEAKAWRFYLQFSEYQRVVEKCVSVGEPVPEFASV
jgi:glycogen debranching enzyme